jgi:hypothetical protein
METCKLFLPCLLVCSVFDDDDVRSIVFRRSYYYSLVIAAAAVLRWNVPVLGAPSPFLPIILNHEADSRNRFRKLRLNLLSFFPPGFLLAPIL